jgi:hypothetical protein
MDICLLKTELIVSRSRFIGEEEVVQSAEIKEYLGNTDYAACR